MNAPDDLFLPDVQSGVDRRELAIQRVGVKSLTHPVLVASVRGPQPSVASIDMYVGLPAEQNLQLQFLPVAADHDLDLLARLALPDLRQEVVPVHRLLTPQGEDQVAALLG